jgi:four helix bundle protein
MTSTLPLYLRWRLGGQIDDALDSIGANLAEGHGRKNVSHGNAELIRYAHMANGSACEAEHRMAALSDRNLITATDHADFARRIDLIKAMLWRLIERWKRDDRGRLP